MILKGERSVTGTLIFYESQENLSNDEVIKLWAKLKINGCSREHKAHRLCHPKMIANLPDPQSSSL